ncbi:uncharacterized protein DSM5745_04834 [Aspergillus mulundensis]|uniref:RING-type E3 ubiquitin transferase n=1 Tax=Aspergillus mulundensis TaxID=1810919 RepID=A0A3D8S4Q6_9EURO|nr:hypothetical protein DSM5745_04834 [Aspergillus mulundensis]RDW81277.1 hypothetical protein DSM5745_04834 [Aspergillus mulundensis]
MEPSLTPRPHHLDQYAQKYASSLSRVPCRFYARGNCRDGDKCRFSHTTPPKTGDTDNVAAPSSYSDTRGQVPCQFYLRGICRNGDGCPYSHTGAKEGKAVSSIEETNSDNFSRQIAGAIVTFIDGAKVEKISFPSDFSAVHLGNLPPNSSPSSITNMLAQLGLDVPASQVRVRPLENGSSADVRMEDSTFAKTLCAKLAKDLGNTAASRITAITVSSPVVLGSNAHRVDSKKVHCSWHRPSRTVRMSFGSQSIARKVESAFNAGIYKVVGQAVRSVSLHGSRGGYHGVGWTLSLSNLPANILAGDILSDIPVHLRPRRIGLGDPSYDASLDEANTIIKSQLLQIGPLEYWESAAESGGKRAKAKARFQNEEDARSAAAGLNETALPFHGHGRLTVQLVHSARFKVSERIYQAVRPKVGAEETVWKAQHLVFIPYEPVRGYRVLKLEGESTRDVARAKKALEEILEGMIAMSEGNVLWSPSFSMNGDSYRMLKDIEERLGIVVVRSKRLRRIHLYGPEEKCKEGSKLIVDISKAKSTDGHSIELDDKQFNWVCHGGFQKISATLGVKAVALDIMSKPKRLLLKGSAADYKLVLSMLAGEKEDESFGTALSENDCSICWTEADNAIKTHCRHTYCADCFEMLCFSELDTTKSTEPAIRCQGGSGKCNAILPLDELWDHLPSSAFEDLLEASFKSHIRRHPQQFQYCPTPDCNQVYRTTTTGAVFHCSNCLIPVCTTCHASHPGMTCAEQKDFASGGYEALAKAKKELGIKDCPACKTAIEKTEGCNHMECRGCGTHICWKCMKTFARSAECYTHMNREHGSIGLDFAGID